MIWNNLELSERSNKPRLLDLFCCAGGTSMGYYRAGFEVVGVDIKPQPDYPFEFHQANTFDYSLDGFDAYHASPPCQRYSEITPMYARYRHPDLIDAIRQRLLMNGKPFIIENVENARHLLLNPLMLCGLMFNLPVWRHRYFELHGFYAPQLPHPIHIGRPIVINPGSNARKGRERTLTKEEQAEAMGIYWMKSIKEIKEAIPPDYTEYIGQYLIKEVERLRQSVMRLE